MKNKLSEKIIPVRILITGGTFDKEYDEISGKLYFKDTHMQEILELGRSRLDVKIRTLMLIDSLDMTADDRRTILDNCLRVPENQIVITHGTDTMVKTAKVLAEEKIKKNHSFHRRHDPLRFWQQRRAVQYWCCFGCCPGSTSRCLYCHEWPFFPVG